MAKTPNLIRDTLQAIGEAVRLHMILALENGSNKYPLSRFNSELLKSIKVEVLQGRDKPSGRFESFTPNAKLLIYAKYYAEYLDQGRKPLTKKIPISVLIPFIQKRKMKGRDKKTGKFFSTNQLAFMIQNSIYRKGIRGRKFIQPAWDEGQRLVELYLDSQFMDDITYELTQLIVAER